jgi:hypothetical protein
LLLLHAIVLDEPLGRRRSPPDLQKPSVIGRDVLRGQFARGVHGPGQLAHEEVVVLAEALDCQTHLPRRRRVVDLLISPPLGGREQCWEKAQVFSPDVNGKPRPQVVQLREHSRASPLSNSRHRSRNRASTSAWSSTKSFVILSLQPVTPVRRVERSETLTRVANSPNNGYTKETYLNPSES